ncbi:MAG TPA: outer membrane protein transport protein [Polyangia bacterium]|jgi:long-chain fatty acid transport protein
MPVTTRPRPRAAAPAAALTLAILVTAGTVHAGGQFLPGHGIRPMGRANTFVAGGDDVGVLWFNPGGLDLCGNQTLGEAALLYDHQSYARIDSGGNPQAEVSSSGDKVPVPTIGAAIQLRRRLTLGLGFSAPYGSIPRFPADGAQRYSIIDRDGSFLARVDIAASYRIYDGGEDGLRVSLGASLQDWVANLESRSVLNACPGTVTNAPEDPQCDSRTRLQLETIWNPSAAVGVHARWPRLRLGASFQLPVWVSGTGKVQAGIPTSPLFRDLDGQPKASQSGDAAVQSLTLPWIVRVGAEYRATSRLRFEGELDIEGWSMSETVKIQPQNVQLTNMNGGIPSYQVGDVSIVRKMRDTFSVRVGGEYDLLPEKLVLRAGFGYESGSLPNAYISVLSVDMAKQLLAVGASWWLHRQWRLDVAYSHVFMNDASVPLSEAAACQVAPIRPATACVPINAGSYRASYDTFGLGLLYAF